MTDETFNGYSDGYLDCNPTDNPSLRTLVEARYSRRQTIFGGVAALTTAALGTSLLTACDGEDDGGTTPLQVSAGQSATTSSGRAVSLSGSTSFDVPTVGFQQVSGPTVTLVNAGTMNASFLAPSVAAATPLVFRFTGTDFAGRTASAETTITVNPAQLGFTAVAKNRNDIVTVAEGYTVTVLYRLGDPIAAGIPAYKNDGTDTDFGKRAGDHHDALYYYSLGETGSVRGSGNSNRGLLVMNHENITQEYLHPTGPSPNPRPESEALKEMEAHGVAVIEVSRGSNGQWGYSQASSLNRRVTALTETELRGPAAGSARMRTAFSPAGTRGRGTVNNCANGYTEWGTYLTCEENWAFYFRRDRGDAAQRTAAENVGLARYGIREGNSGNYGWSTVTPADTNNSVYRRWNATAVAGQPADGTGDFRNEPNQFGWVVEIDPYDPTKAPRKRTALGRMGHEGSWPGPFVAGRRPAFYMGDDSRDEYFFKFVSATPWVAADANAADRLAIGDKYLDNGTLYVARFNEDGTGTWLPLVFGQVPNLASYTFADQADILIHARLAADALGATKMDRPEWTATNPVNGEIYLTLTNTNARTRPIGETDAANPRFYNDPARDPDEDNDENATRSQIGNPNGHIIRIRETGDSTEATGFSWDIYLFGAGRDLDPQNINISRLDDSNDFSSPDGIWFSRPSNAAGLVTPVVWIQTDDGAYTDVTHNQMLAAMPGRVGDGGAYTVTNTNGTTTDTQGTFVGRQATPATLRRFLVGPKECEITGIDSTPDGRTIFVNIQHPGEDGTAEAPTSNWPQSQAGQASGRPRSATIVITKNDGGVVGL